MSLCNRAEFLGDPLLSEFFSARLRCLRGSSNCKRLEIRVDVAKDAKGMKRRVLRLLVETRKK